MVLFGGGSSSSRLEKGFSLIEFRRLVNAHRDGHDTPTKRIDATEAEWIEDLVTEKIKSWSPTGRRQRSVSVRPAPLARD